jgi:predicted transglutaminase-like cysteine proteinase
MNIRKQLAICASLLAVLAMSSAAQAGHRPFLTRGDAVAAPPGFLDLCARDEASCGAPAAEVAPTTSLALTTLSTSSLGRSWPLVLAAATKPRLVEEDGASGFGLTMIETLTAYRPLQVEDFLPAGTVRPAAVAPTALAAAPVSHAAELDKSQLKLITAVNRNVNREVHKASDFDLYGLQEFWSLPRVVDGKMYGDCEDFALEKRRRLVEAGVPAEALSMAVVVTRKGERHAVLVVAFETGDMVLDNLTPWPTPWAELNYTWVQRQVAGTSTWTTVG